MTNLNTKIIKGAPCDVWDIAQAAQGSPFIYIQSNGSHWAGTPPDDVETLLDVLAKHTLDPRFEEYGNFITHNPHDSKQNPDYPHKSSVRWINNNPLYADDVTAFFGNFYDISHVFSIHINVPSVIEKLTRNIRKNQQTDAYKQAKEETCKPNLLNGWKAAA